MSDVPHPKTLLRWTAIGLAALVAAILVMLALLDANMLKRPIERIASARSGRSVVIAGRLQAHLWSWTPGLTLEGLTVGNPAWETARPMIQAQRLQLRVRLLPLLAGRVILERLEMVNPIIYLHRDAEGRANWTFESKKPTNEPAGPAGRLPIVRNFVIESGHLTLVDEILHLDVEATVHAHEQGTADDPDALRLEGKGTVNKQPLSVRLLGGPLLTLDPARPYPFAVRIAAGDMRIESDGVVRKPFDLGRIGFVIRASGNDLANLYYLTQLALPNTPPFNLQASIERNGAQIQIDPLTGKVGSSDLRGQLNIDISHKRPTLTGDLVSKQLRLRDLAASLGGTPKTAAAAAPTRSLSAAEKPRGKRRAPPATAPPQERLFPDARLQVNRVRAMNADVRFAAVSIEAGNVPLKQVALHIKLNDGVLSLDPFEFQMPEGKLHGTANIDARGSTPDTQLDFRVSDIELSQFKGKSTDAAAAPLAGDVQARIVARGYGDSVHDFVSDANGTVTFILPHGEIRAAFAELTGINVAEGLGLLLKGSNERAQIRCGVAQFAVQDGTMRVGDLVLDTQNVRITGNGEVSLGPEELDVSIRGEPKKLRLTRLKVPVRISGHLLKPSVGINVGQALKQGAIATALGAAIAPLAAVIAFVDPGLAKDENCSALLASAQNSPAAPKP